MTRIERALAALGTVAGAKLRVFSGERPAGGRRGKLTRVPGVADTWLEVTAKGRSRVNAAALAKTVGALYESEEETRQVASELSARYEEIDLIYTISEVLGHTIRLSDAAGRILREVSDVVGARRATLLAVDEGGKVLRIVAAQGMNASEAEPIEVDDPSSIAARVFREGRVCPYNPSQLPR